VRPGGITESSLPVLVGREGSASPRPFRGLIDEVRIFNRTLSDAEIQGLYQSIPAEEQLTDVPEPQAGGAPQEGTSGDIRVISAQLSPNAPALGDLLTLTTTVVNFGDAAGETVLEVTADKVVVATQTIQVDLQQTKSVQFTFPASKAGSVLVAVGGIEQTINVADTTGGVIRVGPTVRLSANQTVVTNSQDAIVDLFWDNSALNEVTMKIEVTVDVPTGLYLYSQQGGMACAAGTCKGLFSAPPGKVRNLPIIVKADAKGDYFLHLLGRYWPEGDPDQWNPISLTTPIKVREASPAPADPEPTNSKQVEESVIDPTNPLPMTERTNPFFTPWGLAAMSLGAIVIVVLGSYWAIRAFRPDISIGPFNVN